MIKVAVIGCGGINSWSVKHLRDIFDTFLSKDSDIYVKLFDEDIVEEKNILRQNQNFGISDLMLPKAEVLAKRYRFDFVNTYITPENIKLLDNFDHIILGVDNHKTRRLVYEHCLNTSKYLLDLRAQGTQIGFVVLDIHKTMEYYDKEEFNNASVMDRKGSCQLDSDIEKDNIQTGNRIISFMGIYGIYLKKLRGDTPLMSRWKIAY